MTLKHDPDPQINLSNAYDELRMMETYITKPMGKTNPPKTLTRPGLLEAIPPDPASITSVSKPLNPSITPVRNYSN